MKARHSIWILPFLLLAGAEATCQTARLSGQLIGWSGLNGSDPTVFQAGARYIPALSFSDSIAGRYTLEGEASLNLWGSALASGENRETDGQVRPYRLWLKFSGHRFELRAGLQKINFGAATLLRPLMWFDRMDPRDPLQLTDGVYGLLGRYYFLNNANIWLWTLYGNGSTKGWELYPTREKTVEYGGRMQWPLFTGEMAMTYHHRTADAGSLLPDSLSGFARVPENRLALDGKFDLGVGLWFEGVLIRQDQDFPGLPFRQFLNLGTDYTFGLGNGLHVSAEMLYTGLGKNLFKASENGVFGGLAASYPIGLIHQLQAILFYDFREDQLYRFVNWSLSFDNWTCYLMGYWNPEQYRLYQTTESTRLFTGAGFQLMAVFNY